jgi:hypothetical protein
MPFFYDLKVPDEADGSILLRLLIAEHTLIEANTAIACLTHAGKELNLRAVGSGVLSTWYVKPGEQLQQGQLLARMRADGENIPYGRPYLSVESTCAS